MMEQQNEIAAAIYERRKDRVYKTGRATYESLSPLCKLIADACIRIGSLVITED